MKERLQKLMAMANIASRRTSEEMIRDGRVKVNGKVASVGDKADPETDTITVDGAPLKFGSEKRYIAFYKPINVLSSNKRQKDDNRSTVREVIPVEGHLFTIGRLDAESEGLMVLTNDGELAHRLTHPRYEHTKTYKVTVYGKPSQETLDAWERGIWLDDERTAPCSIRAHESEGDTTTLRIVMVEGKKRQIRRVASMMGHPVRRLIRTHIGELNVGTLRRGEWIDLTDENVQALQTPVSDISYIRRLRKEQRQQRKREYVRRQKVQLHPRTGEDMANKPEEDAAPKKRVWRSGQLIKSETSQSGQSGQKPPRRPRPTTGGRANRPGTSRPGGKPSGRPSTGNKRKPSGSKPSGGSSSRQPAKPRTTHRNNPKKGR